MKKVYIIVASILVIIVIALTLVGQLQTGNKIQKQDSNPSIPTRESAIPSSAVKITPQTDSNPPKSLSTQYYDPVPVEGLVNTAGAEDSAFIISNGSTIYFFFTPDMDVQIERQVLDPTVVFMFLIESTEHGQNLKEY